MSGGGFEEQEFSTRLDWGVWRKVFAFAAAYKRELAPLAVLSAVTGGIDSLFTLVVRTAVDGIAAHGAQAPLARYAAMYAALAVGLAICVWFFIRLAGRIATHMSHDIRRAAFHKLQDLSFSYYDKRAVGWLMARMTSDCERVASFLAWGFLEVIWGFTLMASVACIMLWLDWRLALVILAALPLLAWISLRFQRAMLSSSRDTRKANSRLTAAFNESIMGVATTKSFTREQESLREFEDLSETMRRAAMRNALQSAYYFPIVMLLGSCAAAIAMWLGGEKALAGGLSIGTLVAFVAYAREFFWPMLDVARVFSNLQVAQASAERVIGLIDETPDVRDSEEALARMKDRENSGPKHGLAADGWPDRLEEIEFRHVSFAYREGKNVLEDFHLRVSMGESIALVGPTGGGKTTIVSLLCRFYEPTRGEILVDGIECRRRSLLWLQSKLGIVLQTPHLFSGTIRENIRYGRLTAGDAEVEAAARGAGAHEFIGELKDGYATQVGEGGAQLSTGQRQLVSFARALLADPRVFVMDEATSSVDAETEGRIQRGIESLLRGRISFIIAHRLSTIRRADRILYIDGGRIVEQGSHGELMERRGPYFDLYSRHFIRESEEAALQGSSSK